MKGKSIKIFLFLCLLTASFSLVLSIRPAAAAVSLQDPLGINKSLDDAMPDLSGRIVNSLLGIIGAIALIIFIYGGAILLISAGRPDWIKRGWDIIFWSAFGLITIFVSYILLNFILMGLQGSSTQAISAYTCPQTSGQTCEQGGICPSGRAQGMGSCADGFICCQPETSSSASIASVQCGQQGGAASQSTSWKNKGFCEVCWGPNDPSLSARSAANGWVKIGEKTCPSGRECWKCTTTANCGVFVGNANCGQ